MRQDAVGTGTSVLQLSSPRAMVLVNDGDDDGVVVYALACNCVPPYWHVHDCCGGENIDK